MTSAAFLGRAPSRTSAVALYWRVTGVALAAVAAVGILLVAVGKADLLGSLLAFDPAHNVLHVALAVLAIGLGFGAVDRKLARNAARAVGGVYLALGLVGFASPGLFGLGDLVGFHLEAGEDVLHLALGAWGLYAGFAD